MKGTTTRHVPARHRLFVVSVAAVALAAGAWTWAPHAWASDVATFNAAYEAGAAARKAARKAGFEWRDTKKMLRQAKKLAKKGEYAKAVELANRAKRQSELGIIQADEQVSVWREAVLK